MPSIVPIADSFNPRPIECAGCKKAVDDQVLMVGDSHVFECENCGKEHLCVSIGDSGCTSCGCSLLTDKGPPPDKVMIRMQVFCRQCRNRLEDIKTKLESGDWIEYRCSSCGAWGVAEKTSETGKRLVGMFPDRRSFVLTSRTHQCDSGNKISDGQAAPEGELNTPAAPQRNEKHRTDGTRKGCASEAQERDPLLPGD